MSLKSKSPSAQRKKIKTVKKNSGRKSQQQQQEQPKPERTSKASSSSSKKKKRKSDSQQDGGDYHSEGNRGRGDGRVRGNRAEVAGDLAAVKKGDGGGGGGDGGDGDGGNAVEERLSAVDVAVSLYRQMSSQKRCDMIAELSQYILEDPQKYAFKTPASQEQQQQQQQQQTSRNAQNKKATATTATTTTTTTTAIPLAPMKQLLLLADADRMKRNAGNTGTGGRRQGGGAGSANAATTTHEYTAQLAVMSLLAVFQDIIPSYRIRLPTKDEMAVKVSRETKEVWDYERNIMHHYQMYLQLLERTWKSSGTTNKNTKKQNKKNKGKKRGHSDDDDDDDAHHGDDDDDEDAVSSLSITAILSLCELLKTAFHFNFRSNLLTMVVRQMNHPVSQVSGSCCGAVSHVFRNDGQGDIALEATRQVCKMMRDRKFRVRPDVLRTFLSLPLRVHADEAEAAKIASQANARKRKRDREAASIDAELREGHATTDKIVLARCQSEMLQAVVVTYFRVLKSDPGTMKPTQARELLPAALEGLAKFAHLINIDTVVDLLAVLKQLLEKVDALPLDAALNCVLTAFQTLQGPGKEMKIDVKEYVAPLYRQLPRFVSERHSQEHAGVLLRCLNSAFLKRREYSTVRIAAFLKQILTTAMHAPAHTSVPLLALARQLVQRYPAAVQQMIDENEQDVVASGVYEPDVDDPEHSNPLATSAWELAAIKFHANPAIRQQAANALAMKLLQLPNEEPGKLRTGLLRQCEELDIPFQRNVKKHPLAPKTTTGNNNNTDSSNSNKKQRQQVRFISQRAVNVSTASSRDDESTILPCVFR